jgi:CheY-like chemotaxis protein
MGKPWNRILLVEDSDNDAELTLAAFGEYRLANGVDRVRDGAEALDYLFRKGAYAGRAAQALSVVLLDLKLPMVDGLEVLRAIRSEPHLKALPVVVLTSSKEEGDMVRSYQWGVNAYVVKPVDFSEFAKAVGLLGVFWALINEPPPASML